MIEYVFDDDIFEYEPDMSYRDWVSFLKDLDKSTLIDIITDIAEYSDLEEYFKEELYDMFENEAYNEYLDCKESEREFEHLYFEFMSNR